MAQLDLVALAASVFSAVFSVASTSYLPALIDRYQLADGNAKLSTTQSLAGMCTSQERQDHPAYIPCGRQCCMAWMCQAGFSLMLLGWTAGEHAMKVRPVDPRDTRWEVSHPAYRVYFWEQQRPNDPGSGWMSAEWEIEDGDVDEVLSWAHDNAAGRRFVVYARVASGQSDEPGLVRLLGTDPFDELSGIHEH